jgi:putative DNA primase/helicase
MKNRELLRPALAYAARGWAVFPLEVGGKRPLPGSRGHKDASDDPAQIKRWWAKRPHNIGIACDDVTGPLVVDVDGRLGEKAVRKLALPPTLEATSGRPHRRHLYYDAATDGQEVTRRIKVRPDLDVLGRNGYVVAPPSRVNGRVYRWTNERPLEPFPPEMLDVLADERQLASSGAPPLPKQLHVGQRDTQLTSLAGSMRRRGASEDVILAALREMNEERCRPLLEEKQLVKIARSIGRKAPATLTGPLTTDALADLFLRLFGNDVLYLDAEGKSGRWLVWDGTRWKRDRRRYVEHLVREVTQELFASLADPATKPTDAEYAKALEKFARQSAEQFRREQLVRNLRSRPELARGPEDFDRARHLLTVANGTLDLTTGRLLPHKREDYITRAVPVAYDPSATCPRWLRFLKRVVPQPEVRAFLQRAVGYSLTGDVTEHCLFFLYGRGRNGKTTFLEALGALVPEHAVHLPFDTLLKGGPTNEQHRHLARLEGARVIIATEPSKGKAFDEAALKQLTGGDRRARRRLYQEGDEYAPTDKFWLAGNHQPDVHDQTLAMWERIHCVAFAVTIPRQERDKALDRKLRAELPGILAWAVRGCLAWARDGLAPPSAVRKATRAYREETDVVGAFIEACATPDPKAWHTNAELYAAFKEWWWEENGRESRPWSANALGMHLKERGLQKAKREHVRGWHGLALRLKT